MNGGRCSTTRIWRPPSSTASWSADGSFASMDPRDELVISSSRTPCQAVPNGSEYLEYVAQNFRNPHSCARNTTKAVGNWIQRRSFGYSANSSSLATASSRVSSLLNASIWVTCICPNTLYSPPFFL